MIEISLRDIKKSYGFNNVLDNLSLEIKTGDKIGIIGDNGCGKSTCLNIICGKEKQDSGILSIRNESNIAYLYQNLDLIDKKKNVKEILYEGIKEILDIENLMKKYEKKMIDNPNNISTINKYLNIQDKFTNKGGYEINTLIEKFKHGLNINKFTNMEFEKLSGGEKVRLKLFELINNNCNFILLDEITNHIDIDTKEILEDALKSFKGTILFISHDRYFINKVANKVLYINNNTISEFIGNYDYFIEHKNISN